MKSDVPCAIAAVAGLVLLSACGGGGGGGTPPAGQDTPEATAGVEEGEAPDQSDVSFVDNLLVKVEAEEWTLGEGLVATLKLFAGELDAADVLRHPDLLREDGTGIFDMARKYLEDGSDADARAEITRLLGLLVFTNEQLEAMAGITPPVAAEPGRVAAGRSAQTVEDCLAFFGNYELPPGVGQCLEYRSSELLEDFFPGAFRLFVPASSFPTGGWTEKHINLALAAMEDTVFKFKERGTLSAVNLVFSLREHPEAGAIATPRQLGEPTLPPASPGGPGTKRPCGVAVFTSMQRASDGDFKQVMAHELAHCLHGETFAQQYQVEYEFRRWWDEGLADYLSNVIYPKNNMEWGRDPERRATLEALATFEIYKTLLERAYSNFLFFQFLHDELGGDDGIFDLIRTLARSGGRSEQEAALASYPGIDRIYHDFAKAMTDKEIEDTSGEIIPYPIDERNRFNFRVAGKLIVLWDWEPFGVYRFWLFVDPDKEASLAFAGKGQVRSSARPDGGKDWADIPVELPEDDSCNRQVIVVVTGNERGGFVLEVSDVREGVADEGCDPCLVGEWVMNNEDWAEYATVGIGEPVSVSGQFTAEFGDDGQARFTWAALTRSYVNVEGHDVTSTIDGGGGQSYSTRNGNLLTYSGPELTPIVTATAWYGEVKSYPVALDTWYGDVQTSQFYECEGDSLLTFVGDHEIGFTRVR